MSVCHNDHDVKGAANKILAHCRAIEENPHMALTVLQNIMGIKSEAYTLMGREPCGYSTKEIKR